ncbi:MAG: S49 family peptidase [Halofilum sp. (in: g-proteobacteria)]|nr:S49 family peptidase [Halofilum sp. (in: g-proteobacteria)]
MAETDEDLERGGDPHWERDTIRHLAAASLAEQRRARRWGILFKSLVLLYLFAVLFAVLNVGPLVGGGRDAEGPHTALVEVEGMIAASSDANADRLVTGLRNAFESEGTRAVIVRINSPGGSPVQAGLVYDEIRRLRAQHPDTPVYAVATDLCASGGYYIAAAADRIYANRASMVGSIGVRFASFGFVGAMDKLGVTRRMITAGDNKAMLDPFLPQEREEVAHIERMVDAIHAQFIAAVREGRGERLAGADPELFSGLVWTGKQAVEKGLVDDLASASYVAREVVGAERIVDFTPRRDLLERFSERVGAALADTLRAAALTPAWR